MGDIIPVVEKPRHEPDFVHEVDFTEEGAHCGRIVTAMVLIIVEVVQKARKWKKGFGRNS